MPLDGHSYLVAQGWSGKGSGLRHGSISRPLAIPQKKTLSGLGKDRDEASRSGISMFNDTVSFYHLLILRLVCSKLRQSAYN